MRELPLTYAGADYWDRTLPLLNGTVRPRGIDLRYRVLPLHEVFRDMVRSEAFDASEMALSTLIAMVARGDHRFLALPIFPSRAFRHAYIFVSNRAGITDPRQLAGRTVGLPEYEMTTALWVRGFLQDDFGVAPDDIEWRMGGLRTPGYIRRTEHELPPSIRIQLIPQDRTLEDMLDTGELDALITPFRPPSFIAGAGRVSRLFANSRAVERDYFLRTGLFPIMHVVVVRRAVLERDPWIAESLREAFGAARRIGYERLITTGQAAVGLPWLAEELEEAQTLFKGADPYACERGPNENVLRAACRYSFQQGLSPREVSVDELFAPARPNAASA